MHLFKTLTQRSGFKALFWSFLAWVGASLPEWVGAWDLPKPWDGIVAGFAAFVSGAIRLYLSWKNTPAINLAALPQRTVDTLPIAAQEVVADVKAREAAKSGGTPA